MIKNISREEVQVIDLYRKIKNPYNRYLVAEYVRMNAKAETGKDEPIPKALERCDILYTGFCLACEDIKKTFQGEDLEKAISELEELTKRDMGIAYYGKE